MSLNKKYIAFSFLICILIPFTIPSQFHTVGMGGYKYGLPLSYVTFYQHDATSMWFGHNFFNGNAGITVNLLSFILNVIIVFILMKTVKTMYLKIKTKPQDTYSLTEY